MYETSLSQQQINTIIFLEKRSYKFINIFFWIWRIMGFVGIAAIINNHITQMKIIVEPFEFIILYMIDIIGSVFVVGFFLGIPLLLSSTFKRRIKKLKNGNFKVYAAPIIDKHTKYHRTGNNGRKTYYYIRVLGYEHNIRTNSMNYDMCNVGQEVYVLIIGNERFCYSAQFLYECMNRYNIS